MEVGGYLAAVISQGVRWGQVLISGGVEMVGGVSLINGGGGGLIISVGWSHHISGVG